MCIWIWVFLGDCGICVGLVWYYGNWFVNWFDLGLNWCLMLFVLIKEFCDD